MPSQPAPQVIQWQDLKVMSEVDLVLAIAQQKGWKDCEIFGYGDMITHPLESAGWKLIPADLYEYSIPAKGVDRILQIVKAGVRIQGVIIADDTRRTESPRAPAKPLIALPPAKKVLPVIGKVLFGVVLIVGLATFWPLVILGALFSHDPKLIILVDDGTGKTVWVSVLTWFD